MSHIYGYTNQKDTDKHFLVLVLLLHYKSETSNGGGEKEWYFFCLRGRKYRNSIRPNRVTGSGFWKATGIDRPIYSSSGTVAGMEGVCIGLKKSLVYYRGSAGKGAKTDWMMHEYRLPLDSKNDDSAPPSMQEAVRNHSVFHQSLYFDYLMISILSVMS